MVSNCIFFEFILKAIELLFFVTFHCERVDWSILVQHDGKNINNIFDAEADPFDDLDIGMDQDASIHPLTMKGNEEE
jgi:hypothetical protein